MIYHKGMTKMGRGHRSRTFFDFVNQVIRIHSLLGAVNDPNPVKIIGKSLRKAAAVEKFNLQRAEALNQCSEAMDLVSQSFLHQGVISCVR